MLFICYQENTTKSKSSTCTSVARTLRPVTAAVARPLSLMTASANQPSSVSGSVFSGSKFVANVNKSSSCCIRAAQFWKVLIRSNLLKLQKLPPFVICAF